MKKRSYFNESQKNHILEYYYDELEEWLEDDYQMSLRNE